MFLASILTIMKGDVIASIINTNIIIYCRDKEAMSSEKNLYDPRSHP